MVSPVALTLTYGASFLVVWAWCREGAWCRKGACLQDGRHKSVPSPEPDIHHCALYMENACCSEQDLQDLNASPAGASWDRCGTLSPQCEQILKTVVCFYRCSPDATYWPHPQRGSSLRAVPLCHSFCRDWYEVCKSDLTCARDWTSDPRGLNCTGTCIPYQQMYQHGRDLCESLWGDAFVPPEDEATVAGGHSCGCLNLTASERDVMAARRHHSDELDTTKHRANPPGAQPAKNRVRAVLHKRSAPGPRDPEGSGSGF